MSFSSTPKFVFHHNHSFVEFCNLLILSKSFAGMDKSLNCPLPDAIYTLLGNTVPDPSKVLDTDRDVILPELHCGFLSGLPQL